MNAASRSEVNPNFPSIPDYATRAEPDSHRVKIGEAATGQSIAYAVRRRGRSRSYGSNESRLGRHKRSRSRGRGDVSSYDSGGRRRREFYRHEKYRLEHGSAPAQDTKDDETLERKRRPYGAKSLIEFKERPLLLHDAPGRVGSDEQLDADENLSHVSDWLDRSVSERTDARKHTAAILVPDASRRRRFHATAGSVKSKSTNDTGLSVEGGAEASDNSSTEDRIKDRQQHPRRPAYAFYRKRVRKQATDVLGRSESRSPRRYRPELMRSDSSEQSFSTYAPRVSTLWFSKSWSVRSANGQLKRPHGSIQTSLMSPTIVTELSRDPLPQVESAPSAFQRVRSWRYNQILPTIEPTLKRVIHATYGDLLQNETLKGPNPPGFIAVPQSCDSQGDTLYHIL
jgi:hypothetical protein